MNGPITLEEEKVELHVHSQETFIAIHGKNLPTLSLLDAILVLTYMYLSKESFFVLREEIRFKSSVIEINPFKLTFVPVTMCAEYEHTLCYLYVYRLHINRCAHGIIFKRGAVSMA